MKVGGYLLTMMGHSKRKIFLAWKDHVKRAKLDFEQGAQSSIHTRMIDTSELLHNCRDRTARCVCPHTHHIRIRIFDRFHT